MTAMQRPMPSTAVTRIPARLVGGFFRVVQGTLALLLVCTVCLSLANVVSRYGVSQTITWADEVQIYLLVWMTFLGAAASSWHNRHLRMDVVLGMLPMRMQRSVRRLEQAVILVVCGFATWHSATYVRQIFLLGQTSDLAGIPMWLPHAAVPIGMALVAAVALLKLTGIAGDEPGERRI